MERREMVECPAGEQDQAEASVKRESDMSAGHSAGGQVAGRELDDEWKRPNPDLPTCSSAESKPDCLTASSTSRQNGSEGNCPSLPATSFVMCDPPATASSASTTRICQSAGPVPVDTNFVWPTTPREWSQLIDRLLARVDNIARIAGDTGQVSSSLPLILQQITSALRLAVPLSAVTTKHEFESESESESDEMTALCTAPAEMAAVKSPEGDGERVNEGRVPEGIVGRKSPPEVTSSVVFGNAVKKSHQQPTEGPVSEASTDDVVDKRHKRLGLHEGGIIVQAASSKKHDDQKLQRKAVSSRDYCSTIEQLDRRLAFLFDKILTVG
ncbi:unnamed protein product [Protopolystoma xenopodis]|uniref:Uncharacterized protein n=1 Tax=Protopolystoma xenopodis TaxID=117903 RepID=A0A448WJ85_9PLAT|nr:unnamed protein product [Protopolystoma xenopodis]